MWSWLASLAGVVFLLIILGGDTSLVIASVVAHLRRRERWLALIFGGGLAILLRIFFGTIAILSLKIPLFQAIGAVVVIVLAVQLLTEQGTSHTHETNHAPKRVQAIMKAKRGLLATIIAVPVVDTSTSLDDVFAGAAFAHGQFLLLTLGILFSMMVILTGSALISELIERFRWVLYGAGAVMGWTAANMVLDDDYVGPLLKWVPWPEQLLPALFIGLIFGITILLLRRQRQQQTMAANEVQVRNVEEVAVGAARRGGRIERP